MEADVIAVSEMFMGVYSRQLCLLLSYIDRGETLTSEGCRGGRDSVWSTAQPLNTNRHSNSVCDRQESPLHQTEFFNAARDPHQIKPICPHE